MDTVGIIGLGYVGLPLAVEFGKKIKTIGYDIKKLRIENLKKNSDTAILKKLENFFLLTILTDFLIAIILSLHYLRR